MSDIRESGSIEQDADLIAFLYREHVYNQAVDPGEAEFIIRKQRSGPIGTVHVRFNPRTVHFDDMPPVPPPESVKIGYWIICGSMSTPSTEWPSSSKAPAVPVPTLISATPLT